MARHIATLALLVASGFSPVSWGASLKPETKSAWTAYLAAADSRMQERTRPGSHFLWIDEHPELIQTILHDGYYVAPMNPQVPKKVPSGLIHDWIGVSFIPNAKADDILRVARDYGHYKDVYRPGVIESASDGADDKHDRFHLRLANKSVVAKTALDVDTQAAYFRLDEHRWYGLTDTVHIREVEKPGTPEEHTLPEDEGTGLIWRLSSITRLEERDGGVYVEIEAIALSRDIPGVLRPFIMPIVKRVSRDSLATSLRQTSAAVDITVTRNSSGAQTEHGGQ